MNLTNIALDNRILELKVGSHLYGTSTPESDIDFCGVFVAPKELYLGLQRVEEVDLSIISKKENGRNDKDAIDRKFYELRKYIKLAAENNPNIIEQLFVNSDQLIFCDEVGHELLANRNLFPHKGCFQKFIGYAVSQKKKMIIKRGNMLDIVKAIELFSKYDDPSRTYVVQYKKDILNTGFQIIRDTGQHIQIGDCTIQKNDTIKIALRKLTDRRNKFSGRYDDYVSKSGYDTKFASHLIRLLYEGIELLNTGELIFPLKQADLISDIKYGNYTIEEIMEMSTELEDTMNSVLEKSDLPIKPQIDKIGKLLIELIERGWK